MGRLDGKNAIITGATGGIGKEACRLFVAEGANVIGVDINEEAGAELAAELSGGDFEFRRVDISAEEEIAELAKHVGAKWSTLDVLYNNAGVMLSKPLVDTTTAEWERLHNVNSRSIFLMMREFRPQMTDPGGSIVNTSSGLGVIAMPDMPIYSATKAGVIMLSRSAAVDFAPGIRVNAILPGVVDTAMPRSTVADLPQEEQDKMMEEIAKVHLLARLARPEEIAAVGLFLASDDASFVTGNVMFVDGGASAV
jgi:NAD(P)-dependent dehydrogenase (short-subunit alcohol dehydrogenase family)